MPAERKPLISLPRNHFIALMVGVCVLSAAIGSGLALLAQTGPQGPAGEQGPRGHVGRRGPQGPAGESAGEELAALEDEVEELQGEVEGSDELEERVEALEEEVEGFTAVAKELCGEGSFIC
ncbi:MAG TPA: hypothetical protein VHE08_06265 [Solirubrobacterales bacterium]|nr:hypothetical protein [Solirubrobacterales bacterium]